MPSKIAADIVRAQIRNARVLVGEHEIAPDARPAKPGVDAVSPKLADLVEKYRVLFAETSAEPPNAGEPDAQQGDNIELVPYEVTGVDDVGKGPVRRTAIVDTRSGRVIASQG